MEFDVNSVPTPCYVVDEAAVERNLEILRSVQKEAGCKILLALKGFAMFSLFPLIRRYLSGVTASSLDEARLGYEEFSREVHVCAPAYIESELEELLSYADHMVFNSFSQWERFRSMVGKNGNIRSGIRVNPEYSEVCTTIYDPCAPRSRLGVTRKQFRKDQLAGISGLHFHALCEQDSDSLERTVEVFEEKFGSFIGNMEWVNFGGGHHISRKDYDIERLCAVIRRFKDRYPVEVYLEPGEAIALNAGVLVATVLDIVHNDMDIAILDTSAAAHMPDVLEMPYRPQILGAAEPGSTPYTYRLGGLTCLSGDVIGDYAFPAPLKVGDRMTFLDMAHYTMVKNNTFNGVRLPSIAVQDRDRRVRVVRTFSYNDYRSRLS
jgi:carboxynorspermidine decarboxylase